MNPFDLIWWALAAAAALMILAVPLTVIAAIVSVVREKKDTEGDQS